MKDRWLIVENRREAREAVSDFNLRSHRILATNVPAYAELVEQGVDVTPASAYLPYDEQNRVARAMSDSVESMTDAMDAAMSDRFSPLPFRLFDAYTFLVKKALDALAFRYHQLCRFVEAERPEKVTYWREPPNGSKLYGPSRVYSALGNRIFGRTTVALIPHVESRYANAVSTRSLAPGSPHRRTEADDGPGALQRLKDAVRRYGNPNRVSGFRRLGPSWPWPSRASGPRVLVTNGIDPVPTWIRNARQTYDLGVDWWTTPERRPVSMDTGRSVRLDVEDRDDQQSIPEEHLEDCIAHGLAAADIVPDPVGEIVADVTAEHIRGTLPLLHSIHRRTRVYCDREAPLAILTGVTDAPTTQVIAQAAGESKTPLVSFQHGGNYGYNHVDKIRFGDLKVPDVFCTWGDGVTRTLRQQVERHGLSTDVVTVGNCAGKDTRRGGTPDRDGGTPTLLYIATGLRGDLNYGPGYWYDDTEYYRHQRNLIDVLAGLTGFDVTVKLHYKDKVDNPIQDLASREPSISVNQSGLLVDLLPAADIALLDYPSTTLLETMLHGAPIAYLDIGWYRWTDRGREHLAECVYWVDRWEDDWDDRLVDAIRVARDAGAKGSYREFLEQYSAPDCDFNALDEILQAWAGVARS